MHDSLSTLSSFDTFCPTAEGLIDAKAQIYAYKRSFPAEFVPPRPVCTEVWPQGLKQSSIEILRRDRQRLVELSKEPKRITSGNTIECYVCECDQKPYRDPELYSYGVLPPMLNPAKIRGPKIHAIDSEDIIEPSSLTKQQIDRSQLKTWDYRPIALQKTLIDRSKAQVRAWDSTVRKLDSALWRPHERHRTY